MTVHKSFFIVKTVRKPLKGNVLLKYFLQFSSFYVEHKLSGAIS